MHGNESALTRKCLNEISGLDLRYDGALVHGRVVVTDSIDGLVARLPKTAIWSRQSLIESHHKTIDRTHASMSMVGDGRAHADIVWSYLKGQMGRRR